MATGNWEYVRLTGEKGAPGQNGYTPVKGVDYFDGQNGTSVTISSTSVTYQVSTSGTTTPTGTWLSSPPSVDKGKYLWTRTIVNYSPSGSTTSYAVSYNGTNGQDGQNGTSVTISSTSITYAVSTSGTVTPTSGWQTTIPTVETGKYLWTKTVVNYSPSGSTTSYSVSYNGTNGTNGTSVSISSTEVRYQASTSGTTTPTGTWLSSPPSVSKGSYLWTRTIVTYSSGNSTTSYSVSYNGNDGATGAPAKLWMFKASHSTYPRDLRSSDSFSIDLEAEISGYDYTPTWTTSAGSVSPSTGPNTTLIIPKNTASDVTITMTATGITPAVFTIHPIDITVYNKNWGTLTALPSGVVLDGDYFIAGSNFSSYVLGKPYVRISDRWDNLTANSVDNTERLFNLMGNVMSSDLTVPSTSAMYAWFGTLVAQDAAIQNLFSKNITILSNGSIHSASYDDDGSYIGPGPGFYLGADGVLKCNSANTSDLNAINANISGNSSFHGSFDCTVIKTTPESPSTYITLGNGTVADSAQAKRIVDQMIAYGLISNYVRSQTTSPMFPIQIVGVSGISYMQVAYQGGSVQSGTARYSANVRFYDSSRNQVNIRNYVTCLKSSKYNWTDYLHSSNYDQGSDTSLYGQWASNGIEIRVLTGLNRLWVDVPTAAEAAALSSGMLFKATTATTVGGVSCYPLYVKA